LDQQRKLLFVFRILPNHFLRFQMELDESLRTEKKTNLLFENIVFLLRRLNLEYYSDMFHAIEIALD
jgi:hypothetical protein